MVNRKCRSAVGLKDDDVTHHQDPREGSQVLHQIQQGTRDQSHELDNTMERMEGKQGHKDSGTCV